MFSRIPSLSTAKKNLKEPTVNYPLSAIPQHRLSNALSNTKKINPISERKHVLESRKLSDKKFHDQCVNKIISFCSLKGIEYKKQNFIFLSVKDVENLFIFFFAQLDIKIKSNNNVDLEILKFLRDLGYPYMLNKSSLINNGTPKSKGTILSIMCFVLDMIILFDKYDASKTLFNRDVNVLDYNGTILKSLISLSEENRSKIFNKIQEDVINISKDYEKIKRNNEEKENEIKRIDTEIDQLKNSCFQLRAVENQYIEFKKYNDDMFNYVKKSKDENDDVLLKIQHINQELVEFKNDEKNLFEQIKDQKYTVNEIQYMFQREKQIDKEISKVQCQIKGAKDNYYQNKLKTNELEDNLIGKFYNFIVWLNYFKKKLFSSFNTTINFTVFDFLEDDKNKDIIHLFENSDFSKKHHFYKMETLNFVKKIIKLLEQDYESLKNIIKDKEKEDKKIIDLKSQIEIVELNKQKMINDYKEKDSGYLDKDIELEYKVEELRDELDSIILSKEQLKSNLRKEIFDLEKRLQEIKDDCQNQEKTLYNFFETNIHLINNLIKVTREQFEKVNLSEKLEKVVNNEKEFFKQLKQKLQK